MANILLPVLALAAATSLVLLVLVLRRLTGRQGDPAQILREELRATREESNRNSRSLREELAGGQAKNLETVSTHLAGLAEIQKNQISGMTRQLSELTESNQATLDRIRITLDTRVRELQEDNRKRLEEMRKTVDEKLETTLEKRLGESFKLVSDRLEKVHQGLGEMQSLAAGVGDLKRVLTNVKARGTWAEVQLGALLEQMLTPDQFARNVQTRQGSREMVEYAVCLPGRGDDPGTRVWLPIDSKFPQEDYLRLQEAAEAGDADAVQKAVSALLRTVKASAREIHDKYLEPPATTDFAIMYLATEGLYAEILRQPGLVEDLQQSFRIVVAGPTTLAAILSSLRLGFQTLAIEERASEVWAVLSAVKTEFGKFGKVLEKMKKQVGTVFRTLEETETRTRAMKNRLKTVSELPADTSSDLFEIAASAGVDDEPVADANRAVDDDEPLTPPPS